MLPQILQGLNLPSNYHYCSRIAITLSTCKLKQSIQKFKGKSIRSTSAVGTDLKGYEMGHLRKEINHDKISIEIDFQGLLSIGKDLSKPVMNIDHLIKRCDSCSGFLKYNSLLLYELTWYKNTSKSKIILYNFLLEIMLRDSTQQELIFWHYKHKLTRSVNNENLVNQTIKANASEGEDPLISNMISVKQKSYNLEVSYYCRCDDIWYTSTALPLTTRRYTSARC
ncbi:hypothetical protein H8356DRAFT_1342941 [Neocallimastix lanati (nom. inval.)]|nr:hypothetical protein H8356DRAFT_1342941 [Neocallimastix sp. JGI-2020a]